MRFAKSRANTTFEINEQNVLDYKMSKNSLKSKKNCYEKTVCFIQLGQTS